MHTSAALAALYADRSDYGDVVDGGRFVDRDRAWARVGLLRVFVEHATPADDPGRVRAAAQELAQIVGALLAEGVATRPRSFACSTTSRDIAGHEHTGRAS